MKNKFENILKKIGEFEKKNSKEDVNADIFFANFYEFIIGSKDKSGIFRDISDVIIGEHISKREISDITVWINYFTHLTRDYIPEISENKDLIVAGRIKNKFQDAYPNQNIYNDKSVLLFNNIIAKYADSAGTNIFSIHKLLMESYEYVDYIHFQNLGNKKIYFETTDIKYLQYDGSNPKKLYGNSLIEGDENISEKLENYKIFLNLIFGIEDKLPKYLDEESKNEINTNLKNISQSFNHFYIINLSIPYSEFKIGTLMLFTAKQIKPRLISDLIYLKQVLNSIKLVEHSYLQKRKLKLLRLNQLKTAIISILIDSYAHNISAHSLAALKWWIELRHKMLDKRFKIADNGLVLNCISPCLYSIDKNKTKETTEKYYEALGLTDSTYNADYYSLYDFLQFAENDVVKDLFKYTSEVIPKEGEKFKFHPRFPVPIDYALYPFFRFLRDKGAFWSGVTRDMAFGGESKTWYKILWEDFANNPLYLGTIAKSEGITKINIYLKVKTKDKNGKNELLEGRFVTIDMSVIDYETAIAESTTLSTSIEDFDPGNKSIKVNQEHLKKLENEIKDYNKNVNDDKKKVIPFVESKNYSKYAFIKLGERFSKFREILDNEENFRVFLPGGIVGEHALFTIFENTIRNIKHYKDPNTLNNIKEKGIDFWISIEEDKLSISKDNSDKKPELFKVGVWLGHETKLITKEETKNDDGTLKEPAEYLLFNITENTLKPILDESTGTPRMGGNSQDKACAAMLFNNKFSSVEDKEKERDKYYFPWIEFKTLKVRNNEESGITLEWKENQKVISEDSRTQYSNSINKDDKGYLKKYFYVWRGEDVLDKNALSADDLENPARAKFLVNDKDWKDEDIIKARKNGVIRLLESSSKLNNIDDLNKLYIKWLNKWIKDVKNKKIVICDNTNPTLYIKLNDQVELNKQSFDTEIKQELKLSHGEEQLWNCNVRSHGNFINYFFSDLPNKNIKFFDKYYDNVYSKYQNLDKWKKDYLLLEFLETIFTKVVIFDNRIFNRFPSSYGTMQNKESKIFMIYNELSLLVKSEDKNEFETWLKQKDTDVNFLVMHLSFIEQLEDNNGRKYSEDNLEQFIQDKLSPLFKNNNVRDNFIFVITSGRGRDKWRESIKNKESKFDKFTIFKPVESLLTAIEQGISYNDHIDIKFNLIKILFGN